MSYLQQHRDYYTEDADLDDWTLVEKLWGENPDLEKQGWDLDSFGAKLGATKREKDRFDTSSITKGLIGGAYEFGALVPGLTALVAKGVGADDTAGKLAESAMGLTDKASQYRSKTSFKDLVDDFTFSGLADWGLHQVARQAPNLLAGGFSGYLGKKVALYGASKLTGGILQKELAKKAAKKVTQKLIEKEGIEKAEKLAMDSVVGNLGTSLGVQAYATPLESTHMWLSDVEKHGVEDASAWQAVAAGVPAGFIETLGGNMRVINRILGNTKAKKFAKDVKRGAFASAGRVIKEVFKVGGGEAFQEAGQEGVAIAHEFWTADDAEREGFDFTSKDKILQLLESAATGAIVGFLPGTATGLVNEIKSGGFKPDVVDEATKKLIKEHGGESEDVLDDGDDGPSGPLRAAWDQFREDMVDRTGSTGTRVPSFARPEDTRGDNVVPSWEKIYPGAQGRALRSELRPTVYSEDVNPEAEILRNENIRSGPEFNRFAEENQQAQEQTQEDVGLDEIETDVGYAEENEFYEQARDHIERVQARTKSLLGKPTPDIAKEPTIAKLAEVQEKAEKVVEARAEVEQVEEVEQVAQEVAEPAPVIEEQVPTMDAPSPDLTGIQVSVPETDTTGKPLLSKGKQRMGKMDATEAIQTVDNNIDTYQRMLDCLVT